MVKNEWIDLFREIRKSKGRFLALFFIVLLGTAFYAGVRSAEPDMTASADRRFDETDFMDLYVLGTLGLTGDDLSAIRRIDGVEKAEGGYQLELTAETESEELILRVFSLQDDLNHLTVTEGRLPRNADECFMDDHILLGQGYRIGDTITLRDDKGEAPENLKTDTFTIVGSGSFAWYLSFERGSASIGDGRMDAFTALSPEAFDMDSYTVIYATVEEAKEQNCYSDAYDEKVDPVKKELEDISEERSRIRYEEIRSEAEEKIDDAKKKIADAEKELADAEKELNDGEAEYEKGVQEYRDGKAEYEDGLKKYEDGFRELRDAGKRLDEGKAQFEASLSMIPGAGMLAGIADLSALPSGMVPAELIAAKAELDRGEAEYRAGLKELAENKKKLDEAKTQLEDAEEELREARKDLNEGRREFDRAKAEADEEIAEGKEKIADAEADLADLSVGEWYVLSRDEVQSCVEYGMDAERIGNIGKVFPVIFFLVAALVSLTTMTRMVEEERTNIGTMKALGFSKLSISMKFILYAFFATLSGGIAGVLVGSKVLPYVIMGAYGILYNNVRFRLLPYHPGLCISSIVFALVCTVGAAFSGCFRELSETPASLMRPPAPKAGKRVFLENVTPVWNRLSFNMKSAVRNLLRYRRRFLMTVLGIGGCMAVLMVSFGLHDSIGAIVDNQYSNIWTYQLSAALSDEVSLSEKERLRDEIAGEYPEITGTLLARNVALDTASGGIVKEAFLFVPEDAEKMKDFVSLRGRVGKEAYELKDDSVVISEKLSRILKKGAGEEIELRSGTLRKKVKVLAVTENYLYHYVYMTPALYRDLFGKDPVYNDLYIRHGMDPEDPRTGRLNEYLLKREEVTGIREISELQETVSNMMHALDLVVWVLVISAGLLVFVVTYNLNNINISERRRELASLKVLGCYDGEVAMYVYRENIFLTLFGIIAGVFLGMALHRYVILTAEIDSIMFGRRIEGISYVYGSLLTILFSVLVNLFMYYKLKGIDMVESLKSVE